MSRQSVEELMDRWMGDAAFREALRRDPQGAVRGTGLALSEDEWAALGTVDWSQTDEQLQARLSLGPPS